MLKILGATAQNLVDQALGVCAPLTYDIPPFISWYYVM